MQFLLLTAAVIINHSYGQRRYVIDNDSDTGDNVALPIDVCFKNKVQGATYLKYTCNTNGDQVTKTAFDSDTCITPTPTPTAPTTWPSATAGPCTGQAKFSCTGDDEYATTGIYAAPAASCTDSVLASTELPAALGCYCDTSTTSYSVDCTSASSGTITKWDSDKICSQSASKTEQALDTCYVAYQYDLSPSTQIPISVEITDCVLAPSPAPGTPTASPVTSAPTQSPVPTQAPEPTTSPTKMPTVSPTDKPNRNIFSDDSAISLIVYWNMFITLLIIVF